MGLGKISDIKHFNSHAHVERDWNTMFTSIDLIISTHTLTWSVTKIVDYLTLQEDISTHTLTWSVTPSFSLIGQSNIFQLTRSRGA